MFPIRIYYVRISDNRQDFLRQVNGLKEMAKANGDNIPDSVWQAVLDKRPMPPNSPILWDWGSRDQAEKRPNFQRIIYRVENQRSADPKRLQEVCIYELDRFGVSGVDEWFHYRYVFGRHGCRILSSLKGDLTAKEDVKTIIETLFEAMNSAAEQRKIAGRTAAQMGGHGKAGAYLGGVPRFGFDLGCFDGEKLVWRLHYLDATERLQVMATEKNPKALPGVEGAETIQYNGKNNHPKRSKEQRYELIPSADKRRVEAVRFLFKSYRDQAPAINSCELARQMKAAGFTTYKGRSWSGDNLLEVLADETYIGRRPYGKRSVAKFKRFLKTPVEGNSLEDVPEEQKGRTVYRDKEDWIIPEQRTHEPLIDEDLFAEVQGLLTRKKKRGTGASYGPRSDAGWLKPIVFCAKCGRGMISKRFHGRMGYHCVSYNYRYQRPGDERFKCEAGLNWIRHDHLEADLCAHLDTLETELTRAVEVDAVKRLEEEVARHEAEAVQGATEGYRNHLLLIWEALELEEKPGQLGGLIKKLLRSTDPEEQLAGLVQVEKLLPSLVRQALDQAGEEFRQVTLALGRTGATPRQIKIWEDESRRLEARIDRLEKLLTPYREQVELAARQYQEKLDQLAESRRALDSANNREKGAALARLVKQVLVWPEEKGSGKTRRILFVTMRNPDVPFIYRFPEIGRTIEVTGGSHPLPFSAHGDPWAEERFRE